MTMNVIDNDCDCDNDNDNDILMVIICRAIVYINTSYFEGGRRHISTVGDPRDVVLVIVRVVLVVVLEIVLENLD